MELFTYKELYEEDGKRILVVNVLPEKYCNFDCVFCPIGRSPHKPDDIVEFEPADRAIEDLRMRIRSQKPDLVYINSKGEALIHNRISDIIRAIHEEGKPVRLLSNGYLLGREKFMAIANPCEEVIAEIKTARNQDFRKLQRPVQGYTLEQYVENIVSFREQYHGKLLFEVTIVGNYNDDARSVEWLEKTVARIHPDRLMVVGLEGEKFQKRLGVRPERLEEIDRQLQKRLLKARSRKADGGNKNLC